MNTTTVAVDLAKSVFELAVSDGQGRVIGCQAPVAGGVPQVLREPRALPRHHGEHAKPGEAVWLIDVNGFWVNGKQVFSDGPSLMPIEGWQDTVLPLK